jgi:hypothetical protein
MWNYILSVYVWTHQPHQTFFQIFPWKSMFFTYDSQNTGICYYTFFNFTCVRYLFPYQRICTCLAPTGLGTDWAICLLCPRIYFFSFICFIQIFYIYKKQYSISTQYTGKYMISLSVGIHFSYTFKIFQAPTTYL